MSRRYKTQGKIGLFDKEFSTKQLAEMGNPLEAIRKMVDFQYFRSLLESKML